MPLPQVHQLVDHWREFPPAHEMLAMLATCYTTWRPTVANPDPPEVAHRKSLEKRWASGYMNIKQMFEGGAAGWSVAPAGSPPPVIH